MMSPGSIMHIQLLYLAQSYWEYYLCIVADNSHGIQKQNKSAFYNSVILSNRYDYQNEEYIY